MLEEIVAHLLNHWALSSIALALILLLVLNEITSKNDIKIGATQAVSLINNSKARILDFRNKSDFEKGHILGSINIDSIDKLEKHSKIKLETRYPMVLIIDKKNQEQNIIRKLSQIGCKELFILENGLTAWKQAGQFVNT